MAVLEVRPDKWYWLDNDDNDLILCGGCAADEIEETQLGNYTGDEVVTLDMLKEITDADTEPYQCDKCLEQNEAYDNG